MTSGVYLMPIHCRCDAISWTIHLRIDGIETRYIATRCNKSLSDVAFENHGINIRPGVTNAFYIFCNIFYTILCVRNFNHIIRVTMFRVLMLKIKRCFRSSNERCIFTHVLSLNFYV